MNQRVVATIPEALRQGKIIADPVAWKSGQITTSVLAGFLGLLVSLVQVFGIELPITDDQLAAISGAVLAVFGLFYNPVATMASTDKIGLKPKE